MCGFAGRSRETVDITFSFKYALVRIEARSKLIVCVKLTTPLG